MKNNILIAIVISVGIVLGVLIYTDGVNKRQQKAMDWEKQKMVMEKQYQLACERDAYNTYDADWDNNCTSQGLEEGCSLGLDLAETLNRTLREAKDRCYK